MNNLIREITNTPILIVMSIIWLYLLLIIIEVKLLKQSIPFGVVFINLFLYYLPTLFISAYNNAFFIGVYDFPFLSLPTIVIGDLVFLPAFDIFAIKWLFSLDGKLKPSLISNLYAALFGLIISTLMHIMWINDAWTGFMDMTLGKLSLPGWIHLIYMALQLYLIIIFSFVFIRLAIYKNKSVIDNNVYFSSISILMFSSLSIADWYVKNILILRRNITASLQTDFAYMSTLVLALAFFAIVVFLRKRIRNY